MTREELDRILCDHAAWLRDEGGKRANLYGANLRGADLKSANLRGANLRGADLGGANLKRTNLRGADLEGADLGGANLKRTNLRGADLRWTKLKGANLDSADLEGAYLINASLPGADLRGADLEDANLEEADLDSADLRGAKLEGANLEGTNFRGANITDTILDPMRPPNGNAKNFGRLPGRHEWCVGYRTQWSPHMGGPDYAVGEWYTAPVFSVCSTNCHPGLYVYPRADMVAYAYPCAKIISVIFRPWDCHRASSKWRVREFLVLEEIK